MKVMTHHWLGLAIIILLAAPVAVFAHAYLDHAQPRVGATIDGSPAEVKIWFTDEVDPAGSSIEVQDADGKQMDKKDLHRDAKDKKMLIISLPKIPPGTYTVIWHAKCACGHLTQGDFEFVVK